MGARVSEDMLNAQDLLRQGKSAAEAARLSGISKGAISKSPECQEIIASVFAKRMVKAKTLLRRGVPVADAAKQAGVSKGDIGKCKECQAIIAEQMAKQEIAS